MVLIGRKLVLVTQLSPAAAEAALVAAIKPQMSWRENLNPMKWMRDGKFMGSCADGKFSLRRDINYRNSFLPFITGTITADEAGAGTRVNVRMKMHTFVLLFMVVWLCGVAMACGVFSLSAVTGHPPMHQTGAFPFTLVPFGMLAFGLALPAFCFIPEANKAEKFLKETLQADTQPDGRDRAL
ncbi:MAG: hypothetical protein PW788_02790 [Micavibrio sp.]|nr:hypothetical protein [Micavibrio sp.]